MMNFSRKHIGRLKVNTVVKAFILAEMFLWSGWNFIMLFFALYVSKLPGGSIQDAATATSLFFFSRVCFVLLSGKLLMRKGKEYKFAITILGMSLISICYVLMGLTQQIPHIYTLFIIIGGCLGMVSPAKNSLFSSHINKEKESITWSALDAGVFVSLAITSSAGGLLVGKYGFSVLFFIAAGINTLAIAPYLIYLHQWKGAFSFARVAKHFPPIRVKYFNF